MREQSRIMPGVVRLLVQLQHPVPTGKSPNMAKRLPGVPRIISLSIWQPERRHSSRQRPALRKAGWDPHWKACMEY